MITPHIILYSHGFGVEKDDRGLFTDIAAAIIGPQHEMFDYNAVDREANVLTVTPLDRQADMLRDRYEALRKDNPDTIIDLVCHSQGSVVAGLAKLDGVRKTILLAPPTRFLGSEQKIRQMADRPGTRIEDGIVSYPRRDGSTTIITQDYWRSRDAVNDPIALYNMLATYTELSIVNALQDEVLGETDYSQLSSAVRYVALEANHDFTGEMRQMLASKVRSIVLGADND